LSRAPCLAQVIYDLIYLVNLLSLWERVRVRGFFIPSMVPRRGMGV